MFFTPIHLQPQRNIRSTNNHRISIQPLLVLISMDPLTILEVALRHSDTLYYLLQQKQEDYKRANAGSAACHENPWNSAGQLREKLADIVRHLQVHCHTSAKSLEECVSSDVFYVIAHSLNAVKVYLYSVVNMSSLYFRADDTTAGTLQVQIAEIICIVDQVKSRINSCGVSSDVVCNTTTAFDTKLTKLSTVFKSSAHISFDNMPKNIRENVDVFRRVVKLADNLHNSKNDVSSMLEGDAAYDNDNGTNSSSNSAENLFALVPVAARELMDELNRCGGDCQTQYNVLQQVTSLWTGWQIERRAVSFCLDEWEERVLLGHGANSAVYGGFLKTDRTFSSRSEKQSYDRSNNT